MSSPTTTQTSKTAATTTTTTLAPSAEAQAASNITIVVVKSDTSAANITRFNNAEIALQAAQGEVKEDIKVESTIDEEIELVTADYHYDDAYDDDYEEDKPIPQRRRRSAEDEEPTNVWGKLVPGACIKGCAFGFYAFSIVSSVVNCLGASGRIGNLLVNYRCVSNKDKSVTQGLILMLVSLFALIPGPIMFGRIIDQTCLVWTEQCSGRRGNCQLYDQRLFRYYINLTACFLTGIGVFFDILVWKFGKNLDLYGEREEEMLKKRSQTTS